MQFTAYQWKLNVMIFFFLHFLYKDAALVARKQEAMEAARRKMQEELDAKAAIFREKQKQVQQWNRNVWKNIDGQTMMSNLNWMCDVFCEQQEEEKRRQRIEVLESMQQGKSYKGTAKLSQVSFTFNYQ